jgi:hypothetical protein
MGLFRRREKTPAEAGPPAAEMRGRAAEIPDAGIFGWEVVWEALKTEPPSDSDSATITQELGLDQEQELKQPSGNRDFYATEFSGTRHGRQVALRMGVIPGLREKGYNEVHVAASVAPFAIREADKRPVAEPGAMPEVEEVLGQLTASDVWRKVEIEAGPDEIVARRPVTAHPQGYVYDLWLVERLADQLGA